jgi:hypothetical protein
MAERQGFEPWEGINPQRFSRPPLSTAQPPLLRFFRITQLIKKSTFLTTGLRVAIAMAFAKLSETLVTNCLLAHYSPTIIRYPKF